MIVGYTIHQQAVQGHDIDITGGKIEGKIPCKLRDEPEQFVCTEYAVVREDVLTLRVELRVLKVERDIEEDCDCDENCDSV